MRNCYFILFTFCFGFSLNAQIVNIPDANFKIKLLSSSTSNSVAKNISGQNIKIDANSDGEIQQSEANEVVYLNVGYSAISSLEAITSFTNLQTLFCESNSLTTLPVQGLQYLKDINCNTNYIATLNISNMLSMEKLRCINNMIITLNVSGCNNLKWLECWNNNQMSILDVSNLSSLELLYTQSNSLTSLSLTNCVSLINLKCEYNNLSSLNLAGLTSLVFVFSSNNNLTNLTIDNLPNLQVVDCTINEITSLNFSNLPALKRLSCSENLLTVLNLNSFTNLEFISFSNNLVSTFDGSNLSKLNTIVATYNNQLQSLFVKNGKTETSIFINNCPNLRYICSDESDFTLVQQQINTYNLNCHVNSYCSFSPGGGFYTMDGNATWDLDTNGCESTDTGFPNLKYAISNETTNGYLIGNLSGYYNIPVVLGNYTVTPVFETPTYYNMTPVSVSVDFNTQGTPTTNDFCITPNGVHSDLEIVIIPLGMARPGFNASYKIKYKNKGNQVENTTININYNDAILDFISASLAPNTQTTGTLSWNVGGLNPFQTGEIRVMLNLNSPTETPPVNDGVVLTYTSTISSVNTDETPNDNTFSLNQTVVNSFDPNDKTCLEGTTITPSQVGKFVHYMIRFENTGTANAQNIVVKDMIDTTKFDITTLQITDTSHPCVTRITNPNKVEFIFENIQLPFDDANNDGYVVFKIKTKPTLVLGNTFSNTASIYFDYNFPIITNTATTTVSNVLANQDFDFVDYFSINPNPAKDILTIQTKENIEVSSINIYNTLGQLVLLIPNAKDISTIDVSSLKTGNYFLKMQSNKGVSSTKFIKE